ncbi:MAG: methyltransferase domain-containing protein [Bacteroidota bacterium]|nr:methyltransferase domain-containing protein [Bacteroidota bacterium]
MDLINQEHWDENYSNIDGILSSSKNDPLIEWIEYTHKCLPHATCLEIGVYPGRYIYEFGERNHEIYGIDLTPKVLELNKLFSDKNLKVGGFEQKNFFDLNPDKKYGIVYSLGFIEHFNDYKSVIQRHCNLVEDNGILFLATPNFSGAIQYFLHKLIDSENIKRHNLKSMNVDEWSSFLSQNGFEIIQAGYIGGFSFWYEKQKRNVFQRFIKEFMRHSMPVWQKIFRSPSKLYSPYCGIIARKISEKDNLDYNHNSTIIN